MMQEALSIPLLIELPVDVAHDLDDANEAEIWEFRGVGDAAVPVFTCLNVGATAVTLLQGPATIRNVAKRLHRWRIDRQTTYTIQVTVNDERVDITGDIDVDALTTILTRLAAIVHGNQAAGAVASVSRMASERVDALAASENGQPTGMEEPTPDL
jgi:hypothetical protein